MEYETAWPLSPAAWQDTQLAPLKGKAMFFEQEIKLYKVIAGYINTAPDQQHRLMTQTMRHSTRLILIIIKIGFNISHVINVTSIWQTESQFVS